MSKENVRLFYDALSKDADLQRRLQEQSALLAEELKGELPEEERMETLFLERLLPVVREAGFDVSYADLKEYAKEASFGELADEELAAVVGGGADCVCVVVGHGEKWYTGGMGCVVWGSSPNDALKCFCFVGGGGAG